MHLGNELTQPIPNSYGTPRTETGTSVGVFQVLPNFKGTLYQRRQYGSELQQLWDNSILGIFRDFWSSVILRNFYESLDISPPKKILSGIGPFLAVHNSSIGDLVCPLLGVSDPTNNQSLHNTVQSDPRDL